MSARHAAPARDPLWWTRAWTDACSGVQAGLTGRNWPVTDRHATDGQPEGTGHPGEQVCLPGNLSLDVGEPDTAVLARRAAVQARTGCRLVLARQVHGNRVAVVDEPFDTPPEVDALVTRTPGLALAVTVADCVPVLVTDPQVGVIAAVHAGRRGMASGVIGQAITAMRTLGARHLAAVVGPSICARCYEVPIEMRAEVATAVPVAASVTRTGTPSLDIAAGVLDQLAGEGVTIDLVDGCTYERDDLFSYRRDQTTGRFAAVIWIPDRGQQP